MSEIQQDPNLPRRASNDPSQIVAKLIEDCSPVFHAQGYSIRPMDLKGYAQFVAGFVDKSTQLREAEEWEREQLSHDILDPDALAKLAAADFERVKHFGSLVSLAEDAYDAKSCLNQNRITHWCCYRFVSMVIM